MKTYNVVMTETELKLFSEFLNQFKENLDQKEFSNMALSSRRPRTPLHQAERNALALQAKKARKNSTPGAIKDKTKRLMKKAGYPKHYIENVSRVNNVSVDGNPSTYERLSQAANRGIQERIAKEKALIENRHAPKYTPDKFR